MNGYMVDVTIYLPQMSSPTGSLVSIIVWKGETHQHHKSDVAKRRALGNFEGPVYGAYCCGPATVFSFGIMLLMGHSHELFYVVNCNILISVNFSHVCTAENASGGSKCHMQTCSLQAIKMKRSQRLNYQTQIKGKQVISFQVAHQKQQYVCVLITASYCFTEQPDKYSNVIVVTSFALSVCMCFVWFFFFKKNSILCH